MSLRTDLIDELRAASHAMADDTARRQRVARAATALRAIDPSLGYRGLARVAGVGATSLFHTTKDFGEDEPVSGELPGAGGAVAALVLALPAGTRLLVASTSQSVFEAMRLRVERLRSELIIHAGVVAERVDAPLHLCTCDLAGLVLERLLRTSEPLVVVLDHVVLSGHLEQAAAEHGYPILSVGGAS